MRSWILPFALALGCTAFGQNPTGAPAFEVASIKPSQPSQMGRVRIGMTSDGGVLRYTNVSLRDCIRTAFRLQEFQVEGPGWLDDARFDIVAKLPDGASEEQTPEMLQALLAERFKLTFHRDSKQHSVYALVAGKDTPKLTPSESPAAAASGPDRQPPGGPGRNMMIQIDQAGAHLTAPSATLPRLAEMLSRFTDRPVVDSTGIAGQYDFDLVFAPDALRGGGVMRGPIGGPAGPQGGGGDVLPADAPATRAGSIYDSVKKYGLKLEPRKAEMETLVIDHIEREPTEN